jgi:hypothetical protein
MPADISLPDASAGIPAEIEQTPALRELMAQAMRFAADIDGKSAACRRKDCRRARFCQLVIDRNGAGHCGAGIDRRMIERAALALAFLARLSLRKMP